MGGPIGYVKRNQEKEVPDRRYCQNKTLYISECFWQRLFDKLSSQANALFAMDQMKEEIKEEVYEKAESVAKHQSASLWEGEIRLQEGDQDEEILAPVRILHKDDSKNGCRLFDWTSGKVMIIHFPLEVQLRFQVSGFSMVEAIKYPMNVLGGKSKPKLKNLKPFIKVFCQTKIKKILGEV